MNKIIRSKLALAAALALMAGTAGAAGSTPAALARVGAVLPLAQFGSEDASALALAARAGTLASVLSGSEVAAAAPDVAARALVASPTHAEFVLRTGADGTRTLVEAPARDAFAVPRAEPGSDAEVAARARALQAVGDPAARLRVMLDVGDHEALALNGAVADDYLSQVDVGPERARAAFDAAAARLRAGDANAAAALAFDAVKTMRLMQAERAPDGPVLTRVKAYLFEVPYALGSIPVFGAEAVLAVHRSGQIASLRLVGPTLSATPQRLAIRRTLSADALEQRARAEHPGAAVVALGLRYPWQASSDARLAGRPHETFQVVPQGRADGQAINGRAHYVFYAVDNERAAPLVWPTPRPDATGDARP